MTGSNFEPWPAVSKNILKIQKHCLNISLSLLPRFGDYPQLPNRSQHERDPWYSWDHPDLRRNWGEPVMTKNRGSECMYLFRCTCQWNLALSSKKKIICGYLLHIYLQMHWDFDMYIRNRVDTSPSPMDWRTMSSTLLGFVGFMLFMFYLGDVFPAYQPVVRDLLNLSSIYLRCWNILTAVLQLNFFLS